MGLAKGPAPGSHHEKADRRNQARLYLLMLLAGATICIRAAHLGTNVITHMSAAWTAAEGSIPHTNTAKVAAGPPEGEVTPKTVPDVKAQQSKKPLEWRSRTSVPVAKITNCIGVWEKELKDDPDKEFILDGIRNGFRLIDQEAKPVPSNTKNYKSATSENKDAAEKQIYEEIRKGRYIISETPPHQSYQA
jgi:hypothetical protein